MWDPPITKMLHVHQCFNPNAENSTHLVQYYKCTLLHEKSKIEPHWDITLNTSQQTVNTAHNPLKYITDISITQTQICCKWLGDKNNTWMSTLTHHHHDANLQCTLCNQTITFLTAKTPYTTWTVKWQFEKTQYLNTKTELSTKIHQTICWCTF